MTSKEPLFDKAVQILNEGGVVAIPTETVYGLAGRIDQDEALKRIFQLKERPFFDPLIVHVKDRKQAKDLVLDWPPVAETLAEKFWPGPLTLVVKKSEKVNDLITSGLPTVGLRCPNHKLTQRLLEVVGVPLAAPSANKFKKTSPTCAEHVRKDLPEVFVLDGGDCQVGIESTILALQEDNSLKVLRQGMIDQKQIEKALLAAGLTYTWDLSVSLSVEAPGQMQDHYQPMSPLVLVEGDWDETEVLQRVNEHFGENYSLIEEVYLNSLDVIAARQLYSLLHKLSGEDLIIFYRMDSKREGLGWNAIDDRLQKASSLTIRR